MQSPTLQSGPRQTQPASEFRGSQERIVRQSCGIERWRWRDRSVGDLRALRSGPFAHRSAPRRCGLNGRSPSRIRSSQLCRGMNRRRPIRTTGNRCLSSSLRSSDLLIESRVEACSMVSRVSCRASSLVVDMENAPMPGREPILGFSLFIGTQPSVDWFATRVGGGLRSRPTELWFHSRTWRSNAPEPYVRTARVPFEQPSSWTTARALHVERACRFVQVERRTSDRRSFTPCACT